MGLEEAKIAVLEEKVEALTVERDELIDKFTDMEARVLELETERNVSNEMYADLEKEKETLENGIKDAARDLESLI